LSAINAIKSGNDPVSLVKLLLSTDKSVALIKDRFGSTPLHIFACSKAPLSVLALLQATEGKVPKNQFENHPIHEALI